jgi:hypothetical protein
MDCAATEKSSSSKTVALATESNEMAKPAEEQIRVRAHELWQQAGKPEGRDDEFWRQAEKGRDGGREIANVSRMILPPRAAENRR